VYNLGSPEVLGLKTLAEMMVGLCKDGSYELIAFPPERKAIDIGDYYGNFDLITRELGWTPGVDLRTGLARTLDYYRANYRHYWDA